MILLLRRWLAFGLLAFAPLGAQLAHAQLSIEIVGGAGAAIPIAIVPFGNEGTWPLGVSGVVGADLARSGMFRLVNADGVVPRPVRAEEVQVGLWRSRNADAVVVGSMQPLPDGRVDIRFALVDVVKQQTLVGMSFVVTPQQFRVTAHKIADIIYEKRKKYKEALGFYEKSLVVEDRVRGPGHPLTKQTRAAVNRIGDLVR
jgi:TolB protein